MREREVDISTVAMAMALAALSRLAKEMWHKLDICSCDRGWFVAGIPCEIGLEEIAAQKAAKLFSQWDALGLGYIGPRLH